MKSLLDSHPLELTSDWTHIPNGGRWSQSPLESCSSLSTQRQNIIQKESIPKSTSTPLFNIVKRKPIKRSVSLLTRLISGELQLRYSVHSCDSETYLSDSETIVESEFESPPPSHPSSPKYSQIKDNQIKGVHLTHSSWSICNPVTHYPLRTPELLPSEDAKTTADWIDEHGRMSW